MAYVNQAPLWIPKAQNRKFPKICGQKSPIVNSNNTCEIVYGMHVKDNPLPCNLNLIMDQQILKPELPAKFMRKFPMLKFKKHCPMS
jgi:hypothetical protein